ncbi:LysR family transcriptional regulator [Rhizobacter sp. Root1221]|uniref:LysR family transcriptional regulator n=1 Tax=Rhizobacter sp. Root1221 TaxID=1736433 RepID=UPI0006FBE4C5|nr:LysR family transcriptional regulator [Rhizobacter sp. Root1221]KQV97561.1 LysR family transcriptional regulator [Rhizobacter sp. Root1221]
MTSIEPNDLLLFARVVEDGSFSRAGERLGLPKSTVSRRVAGLEAQLGERLMLRTTRKLTLTDFGHSVLEHARQVVSEVEAAAELAQHRQAEPSGRLRLSIPGDFANVVLGQLMMDFTAKYPGISLQVDVSPRRVDLIGENFDLAIRMGVLDDDANLAARRLAVFSAGLYASPAYLQQRGTPREPADLMQHDALQLTTQQRQTSPWLLTRQHEVWQDTPPSRAAANSPELLMRLARSGAGITAVADHFAEPYVLSGELEPVLVDWYLPPTEAWAVFPGRRLMPARTRVFLDALEAEFSVSRCEAERDKMAQTRRVRIAAARAEKQVA